MKINLIGINFRRNKYQLLRYFNRNHNIFERHTLAYLGFIGTIVVTKSKALAVQSYSDFKSDDFKIAFRRAAKLYHIYKGKRIAKDNTFNFCEGLETNALIDLENFFSKSVLADAFDTSKLGDYLYVLAGLLESDEKYISKYEEVANKILLIAKHSWQHTSTSDVESKAPKKAAAKLNLSHAYSALAEWATAIPHTELRWFVVSGTFLGLIREKGFLRHDYDIDFGCFQDEFDLVRFKQLISKTDNFFIKKIDYLRNGNFDGRKFVFDEDRPPILIKLVHRTGINIDLFVHIKELIADKYEIWHGSSFHKWVNSNFDLKLYQFIDIPVFGPNNPDVYLTENYGDWRTPVTEFHFNTGTPNLTLQKNPSSLALFIKRISEFRSEKSYLKNYSILLNHGYILDSGKFALIPNEKA